MAQRRQFPGKLKARVVLEAIKGGNRIHLRSPSESGLKVEKASLGAIA